MQLVEILLVILGLNFLWGLIKAPFVWYSSRKFKRGTPEPVDYLALQKATTEEYTRRAIRSLPDPIAAARRLGLDPQE